MHERSYSRNDILLKHLKIMNLTHATHVACVHKHMPHMYSCRFQKHLYYESALSRFDVLTKPIFKCNEDRPYYATQYQDIFIQYQEGFNFVSVRPSSEFDDMHIMAPNKPPSLTP